MVKEHYRLVNAGLRIFDLVVLAAAVPLALWVGDWVMKLPVRTQWGSGHLALAAAAPLLWLVSSAIFDVYDVYRTRSMTWELGRLARAIMATAIGLSVLGFIARQPDLSRLFIGLYFLTALVLLAGNRITLRLLARALRRRGYNGHNYAVVGADELGREAVENIADHPEWGYSFAGYILTGSEAAPPAGHSVLGKMSELGALLETHVLDEVVFAVPREQLADIEDAVAVCEEQGVNVRICLDVFRKGPSKMSLEAVGGLATLALTRTPRSPLALGVKRAFDIAVSGAVLLLLLPFFALVAIAIRIESRGPVLFRQRRVGQNGRIFHMVKFRSMHVDAEARLEALRHFNEAGGPVFKMKNDPRVTRVGRFIRRTSVDELPQFWNVLLGHMSVVGPRPPLPAEVRQYKRWQRRRLSVKPGITCTWQVSGRSNIDFERWMELDLDYIDNWSMWRDVQIVMKTIPAVLRARGAH